MRCWKASKYRGKTHRHRYGRGSFWVEPIIRVETQAGVSAGKPSMIAEVQPTTPQTNCASAEANKLACRIELQPVGTQFSPEVSLAFVMGALALAACVAPWPKQGWLWFELIGTTVALLVLYDAFTLWQARQRIAAVMVLAEKGLRGREGQIIKVPLALTGSGCHELRVGLMPAAHEGEDAIRVGTEPQWLKLGQSNSASEVTPAGKTGSIQLWPWMPEVLLLRRGLWPAPRVGIERRSRFRIWRLRTWFDLPVPLRIEPDLRSGRRQILRSPIYRTLVASQQTPWTGHGRDFERLREYQAGDNYSEIAWKSTARRGAPVTRLFQWEQKQEVYFVVDQSRASALALDCHANADNDAADRRHTRRLLDLAVETALVGATVALELGDEFGLVTYADEPKSWLRAGSGQAHFHQFRERLFNVEPLPTTSDYEALFREIRIRLCRRSYLLVLADLAERSSANSLRRGVGLVRSSHALLMTSVLPTHARPAFSPGEAVHTEHDVYAALAGEKENQRLEAFSRQMRQLDVQLRYIPAEMFLRTAIEGYLKSKREQRL